MLNKTLYLTHERICCMSMFVSCVLGIAPRVYRVPVRLMAQFLKKLSAYDRVK